jgi:hypothetical protein
MSLNDFLEYVANPFKYREANVGSQGIQALITNVAILQEMMN